MPEFRVKCEYVLKDKQQIWNDKDFKEYHRFFVVNFRDLPAEYFSSQVGVCLLWMADSVLKKDITTNFKPETDYQFIMRLGEKNTAHFRHKVRINTGKIWDNNMILKSKQYFENTVQKIGFWDSENYFYELNKSEKNLPQKQNDSNQSQSENKNFWGKVAWICLPILFFFFCLFLLVKWINKKPK